MTNFAHGQVAEKAAAQFLKEHGYKILEHNWRTRYCEIDIVASKKKMVYFVEVKYRLSNEQGAGLEYITPQKLKQMAFAAEMWVQEHGWKHEYGLAAIEVSGSEYDITQFLPDIGLES